jgi:hypothetical protein
MIPLGRIKRVAANAFPMKNCLSAEHGATLFSEALQRMPSRSGPRRVQVGTETQILLNQVSGSRSCAVARRNPPDLPRANSL